MGGTLPTLGNILAILGSSAMGSTCPEWGAVAPTALRCNVMSSVMHVAS